MLVELLPVRLRCAGCGVEATIALPAEESIRHALERTSCPSCGAAKRMRLVAVFPDSPIPEVAKPEDPPDEPGDDELFQHRATIRAWPTRTE